MRLGVRRVGQCLQVFTLTRQDIGTVPNVPLAAVTDLKHEYLAPSS